MGAAPRAEWHEAVQAALRSYEPAAADGDALTLAESWAPFVAYVNRTLPAT